MSSKRTPYVYNVLNPSFYHINSIETFDLKPLYRNPSDPDENGINVMSFQHDSGYFTLRLGDRWPFEYQGEKVRIRVELYKDKFLVDKKLGERTYEFDTANEYEIRFSRDEFGGKKSIEADEPETRSNNKCYVKWGFQRIGNVSTNRYVNKGKTEKVDAD